MTEDRLAIITDSLTLIHTHIMTFLLMSINPVNARGVAVRSVDDGSGKG